jgi:uncharacterized membrane protein
VGKGAKAAKGASLRPLALFPRVSFAGTTGAKRGGEPMNTFLRYLEFLSLTVWVGGIIYLSFAVAPALFTKLPSPDLAGAVVGVILPKLHWWGVVCGAIYLGAALGIARSARAFGRVGALAVIAMLVLTLFAQLGIIPRMEKLGAEMGSIERTPATSPLRKQFDHLHVVSVELEGAVLLLGLAAIFFTVRDLPR